MEICVGVCYRSPNAGDVENGVLMDVINRVAKGRLLLLMGDFNYPMIDWEMFDTKGGGEEFLDVVQDNFLYQHMDRATRGGIFLIWC